MAVYLLNSRDAFTSFFELGPFYASSGLPGFIKNSSGVVLFTYPFYIDTTDRQWNFGYGYDLAQNANYASVLINAGVPASIVHGLLNEALHHLTDPALGYVPTPLDINAALSQTTNWHPAAQVAEDSAYDTPGTGRISQLATRLTEEGLVLGALPQGVQFALEDIAYNGGASSKAFTVALISSLTTGLSTGDFSLAAFNLAFNTPNLLENRKLANSARMLGFSITVDGNGNIVNVAGSVNEQQMVNFMQTMGVQSNTTAGVLSTVPGKDFLGSLATYVVAQGFYVVQPGDTPSSIASLVSTVNNVPIDGTVLSRLNSEQFFQDTKSFGVGGIIHVPTGFTDVGSTPTSLPPLLPDDPEIYDPITGNVYAVGASPDDSDADLFIIDSSDETIDLDTISTILQGTTDSLGNPSIVINLDDGTSQVITSDADGSAVTASYSDAEGAGSITGVSGTVNSNGTIDLSNLAFDVLQPGESVTDIDFGQVEGNIIFNGDAAILKATELQFVSLSEYNFLQGDTIDLVPQDSASDHLTGGATLEEVSRNETYDEITFGQITEEINNNTGSVLLEDILYTHFFYTGTLPDIPDNGEFSSNFQATPDGTGGLSLVTTDITVCYVAGTRIATPSGETPVEQLAIGDKVLTLSGEARPIVWIGVGQVLATRGRRSVTTPVIVRRGAIADNVPHRDLRVTKGHALFIDGVLVPVEFLVNHRSIIWDDRAQEVSIYHIELATHDVLIADGAPAESYRDDGNRWLFQNADTGRIRSPEEACAPILTGGPVVDGIWRRLLERDAQHRHLPLTDDPDLHLLADNKRIDAFEQRGDTHLFRLAARPRDVRICSRTGVPQELGLARDNRLLGVAVHRIVLAQARRQRVIDAKASSLSKGYYAFEAENGIRWTNGDAAIPTELFVGMSGPGMLMLHLGAATRYLYDSRCRQVA